MNEPVPFLKTVLCGALGIDAMTYDKRMAELVKESKSWLQRYVRRRTGR